MRPNPDKILVTGGCGFIGRAVIHHIQANYPNTWIRVLDNLGQNASLAHPANTPPKYVPTHLSPPTGTELVVADVRDPAAVSKAASGCKTIIHFAANTGVGPSVEDPRADMETNVGGTLNVLEAARAHGVARVVFASSGAPAGDVEPPIHEDLAPRPISPYGASKLAGEGYCSAYSHTFGIDTVGLRFSNVYGPGSSRKTSVVAQMVRKAMTGEVCQIFGDGHQTRDFLYISDLVRAVECAMTRPVGGEIFQIASGVETSVLDMVELLRGCLAQHGVNLITAHESARLGDATRNYSDVRKAKELLGWQPTTSLREGLQRTVAWFLSEQGNLNGSQLHPEGVWQT
jgi:UDP-glucose 4-epimerase